jgi:phenylpropionate dioxygenase-like ring-hydroxylating dioxygenase large terminal subunit
VTFAISPKITGWFQIGWSEEFRPGEVFPLHYFGEELVGWRTEDGTFRVASAYCAHLGAHLGHGGRVCGEFIRCPFHGWEWSSNGTNARIPYREKVEADRRLEMWETREIGGVLYLWHDSAGRPPYYEPPHPLEIFDPSFRSEDFNAGYPEGATIDRNVTIHPQYAMEDRVDREHFAGPHSSPLPDMSLVFEDHRFISNIRLGPTIEHGVDSFNYGLSITCFRYYGPDEQISLLCVTPVNDEVSDLFHTVWVSQNRKGAASDAATGTSRFDETKRQLHNDMQVWANIRYTPLPDPPAPDEIPLAQLRAWATRFYPTPTHSHAAGGTHPQKGTVE